ncbi:hypothetical protein ACJRO7_028917 [Eucalyptus globulus]|uniref:Dirigent protein n=1 Tax=Eucalyptus globulus TaxID=34317 RepID=A0ABD3K277_EUCGL
MGNPKNTSTLALALLVIIIFTIIDQSSSARSLGNPAPNGHQSHHTVTFLMRNVLSNISSLRPATGKVPNNQLPFPKPLGLFPPSKGIPLTQPNNPLGPGVAGSSTGTLDLAGTGFSFPAIATLQELELSSVTEINEYLFEGLVFSSRVIGKAQGVYVVSSEDGTSHMMAMTAYFAGNELKDGLRFFGVHRTDVSESHIAVIGGTGLYNGANGYASVKFIDGEYNLSGEDTRESMYLLFTVYLS